MSLFHHDHTDYNEAASVAAKKARQGLEAQIEAGRQKALAIIDKVIDETPIDKVVRVDRLEFDARPNDQGVTPMSECEHQWKAEAIIPHTIPSHNYPLRTLRAECVKCGKVEEETFPPIPTDPLRKLVWSLARKVHAEWDGGLIWNCPSCIEVKELGADLVTPDDDEIRHLAWEKKWL